MALFKPFRGTRATLPQGLHDGYVYFCIDDGTFHIDFTDAEGNLQRKQINAKDAETLTGMTLDEIKAYVTVQSDWAQSDEDASDYIKNRTHYDDFKQYSTAEITVPNFNWTTNAYGNFAFLGNYGVARRGADWGKKLGDPYCYFYINNQKFEIDLSTITAHSRNFTHAQQYEGHNIMYKQLYNTTVLLNGKQTQSNVLVVWIADWTEEAIPETQLEFGHHAFKQLDEKFIPVVSKDEFLAWLNEAKVVEPVAATSGELYTTNNNEMYIL